jgi:hypothetical protein
MEGLFLTDRFAYGINVSSGCFKEVHGHSRLKQLNLVIAEGVAAVRSGGLAIATTPVPSLIKLPQFQ